MEPRPKRHLKVLADPDASPEAEENRQRSKLEWLAVLVAFALLLWVLLAGLSSMILQALGASGVVAVASHLAVLALACAIATASVRQMSRQAEHRPLGRELSLAAGLAGALGGLFAWFQTGSNAESPAGFAVDGMFWGATLLVLGAIAALGSSVGSRIWVAKNHSK